MLYVQVHYVAYVTRYSRNVYTVHYYSSVDGFGTWPLSITGLLKRKRIATKETWTVRMFHYKFGANVILSFLNVAIIRKIFNV